MSVPGMEIAVARLGRVGRGLSRPENVLGFRDGTVFTSSNRGHVTRIAPDGRQWDFGALPGGQPTTMALETDESLLVNDTGDGNLHRLRLDGTSELVLDAIDGRPLGSVNHVFRDRAARTWIAVATRRRPPHTTLHVVPDGYLAVLEGETARIVADGLRWPNEVRLDAEERYAYVSETLAGRIVRFPIDGGAVVGPAETFGPESLGDGAVPDGIALDAEGNLWVAIVSRNGLMVISADGRRSRTVFEQPVEAAVRRLAVELEEGTTVPASLAACAGSDLRLLTSIAFTGTDLRTVVMGSLAMGELVRFTSPVAGLPLQHQHRPEAPPQPPILNP